MKNDRFLLGIMIFIGVAVVAALALFFTGQTEPEYLPEDDPAGIVHNYVLAVTEEDYTRAYAYLAEGEDKPTAAEFRSYFNNIQMVESAGVRVGEAEILEQEAVVQVAVLYGGSGPFDSGYSNSDTAILNLQDGAWKIKQMAYPYWDFAWYQEIQK